MATLTRANLADIIYEEIGLSWRDSSDIVDLFIDEIIDDLKAGNDVKLSSFGTFSIHHKKERLGRNPKTGVPAKIAPRRVVSFHPSQTLKSIVNKA